MKPQNEPYSYTDAGLDGFLSRSIDDLVQANLNAQGPRSTAQAYDRSQVTGVIGDAFRTGNTRQEGDLEGTIFLKGTLTIGNITLDGENDEIRMADNDQKDFLSFRVFPDGTQGFIIVKQGFSVVDVLD